MRFSRPLHGLRGMASLMVFYAHVTFGFYDHFYHNDAILSRIIPYFANFGTYGVELFFVISGFVIIQSCLKYAPREFFGRRFMRLYPLFAMFTLIYFFGNMVMKVAPNPGSISDLVGNLLFIGFFFGATEPSPNAWSIALEVWYYIATYLLVYAFIHRRDSFNSIWAILGIGLAIFMIASWDITAYFVGGVGLYIMASRFESGSQRFYSPSLFGIALFVIIVIASVFDFNAATYFSEFGLQFVALVLLITTLWAVHQVLDERNPLAHLLQTRLFSFAGTISYTVYLVHPYVYVVLRTIGYRIGIGRYPWQVTLPIYLVLITILTISVSWIVHRFVEVGPYRMVYRNKIYHEVPKDGAVVGSQ